MATLGPGREQAWSRTSSLPPHTHPHPTSAPGAHDWRAQASSSTGMGTAPRALPAHSSPRSPREAQAWRGAPRGAPQGKQPGGTPGPAPRQQDGQDITYLRSGLGQQLPGLAQGPTVQPKPLSFTPAPAKSPAALTDRHGPAPAPGTRSGGLGAGPGGPSLGKGPGPGRCPTGTRQHREEEAAASAARRWDGTGRDGRGSRAEEGSGVALPPHPALHFEPWSQPGAKRRGTRWHREGCPQPGPTAAAGSARHRALQPWHGAAQQLRYPSQRHESPRAQPLLPTRAAPRLSRPCHQPLPRARHCPSPCPCPQHPPAPTQPPALARGHWGHRAPAEPGPGAVPGARGTGPGCPQQDGSALTATRTQQLGAAHGAKAPTLPARPTEP